MGWILFALETHPDEQRRPREKVSAARAAQAADASEEDNIF